MLLSVSHRFIMIHVNKAAGTSMLRALGPLGTNPPRDRLSRMKNKLHLTRDYRRKFFPTHTTAKDARKALPPEVFDEFFKFAFVRNPWDWLLSTYHYLCNTPTHRHHRRVAAMGSFAEYVDFEIARGVRSQSAFVCDGDEVIVDYVGRFETIDEDFASVCRRVGADVSLPHVNRTTHNDYREYYDDRLAATVGEHWKQDVALFGYGFDGLQDDVTRHFGAGRPADRAVR
jgi:hypothetical protein